MRKLMTLFFVGMAAVFNVHGEFNQPMSNFEVAGGYRLGNFAWAIAGLDDSPQELWKQKFNNLKMYEVSVNANYTTCNNYYVRFSGNVARIYQGACRNTGYGIDSDVSNGSSEDMMPISRISGEADKGYVYDLEGCVGYQFTSNGRRFVGTPVIGWSLNFQHLKMNHGHQTLEGLTPLHGHHAVYKPRWWGPFVGFDWMVSVEVPCFLLYGNLEYHFSKQYRAKGTWNLDPLYAIDFRDRSKGSGFVINLGGNYKVCSGFFIGVLGQFQKFRAGDGKHHTGDAFDFLSDSDSLEELPAISSTKLRYAKWNSVSVAITLDFRYWDDI